MAKYDPLNIYLSAVNAQDEYRVEMTFVEIDKVVEGLPASARIYPGWWSNEHGGQHVQARSWLDAGYTVTNIDLNSARVSFDLARRGPLPDRRRLRPL